METTPPYRDRPGERPPPYGAPPAGGFPPPPNREKGGFPVWPVIFLAGFLLFVVIPVLILIFHTSSLYEEGPSGNGTVAVVEIEGIIVESREVVRRLIRQGKKKSVDAIVVRIDSPGGEVGPVQEIYEAVKTIRGKWKKVVVASMGGVAASGGYYIACGADKIVANPGTLTGSIGVVMETINMEGLFGKLGLEGVTVKNRRGRYKDTGSPTRKMTREERRLLTKLSDNIYEQFVEAVVQGRGLPREKVYPVADGRVLSGAQAFEAGLVDALGPLRRAVELAAEEAGIEGEPRVVYSRKKNLSPFQELFLGEEGASSMNNIWNMSRLYRGFGVYYLMQ